MAALTMYMTNALASGASHQNMSETSPGATATATPGWIVAKTASANYSALQGNTKRAAATFAGTVLPAAASLGTADAMRSDVTYNGTFDAGTWTLTGSFISLVTGGGTGILGYRVYRSANADGSSSTELTTARRATATITASTTGVTASQTWVPGTTITLTNEYLFVQMAWQINGQSSSTSADELYRVGTTDTRLDTPNFTPAAAAAPPRHALQVGNVSVQRASQW